jgi:hypothetical protein
MIALALAGSAVAGTIGIGAGVSQDLPDGSTSGAQTRFDPAGSLVVPVSVDVAPNASIRATVQGTIVTGRDQIAWDVNGVGRFAEPTRTIAGLFALTLGPEIRFTRDAPVTPYLAGGLGLAVVNNWHSRMERPELFDPAVYDAERLNQKFTLDPFTTQVVPVTTFGFGLRGGALWGELGYDMMFVGRSDLRRGTPALSPTREAYGWNAMRLVVGLSFPLGGTSATPAGG